MPVTIQVPAGETSTGAAKQSLLPVSGRTAEAVSAAKAATEVPLVGNSPPQSPKVGGATAAERTTPKGRVLQQPAVGTDSEAPATAVQPAAGTSGLAPVINTGPKNSCRRSLISCGYDEKVRYSDQETAAPRFAGRRQ